MASSEITLEAVPSVGDVPAEDWDACANPQADPKHANDLDALTSPIAAADSCIHSRSAYNPFVSHAFFSSLESSGSAVARTGWGPRHLLAKVDGRIAGIVPCYLKSHSQGEYVFDRGWADAY
ncbi:peptidogalycan biosysnthesis protein, partial [Bradyrhizobium sp.]|uniref:peptidogalycan biosysnthesis protein n=1 Tax=Bradyrhizobium sp. TaxID=376 RepID=UPI003C330D3B